MKITGGGRQNIGLRKLGSKEVDAVNKCSSLAFDMYAC